MTTLTVKQAADRAGVTASVIRRWCAQCGLPCTRELARWTIDAAELDRWIEANRNVVLAAQLDIAGRIETKIKRANADPAYVPIYYDVLRDNSRDESITCPRCGEKRGHSAFSWENGEIEGPCRECKWGGK